MRIKIIDHMFKVAICDLERKDKRRRRTDWKQLF